MKTWTRSLVIGLAAFLVVAVSCGDQLERNDAPSELSVRDIAELPLAPSAVVDLQLDDLAGLLDGLDAGLDVLDRALTDSDAAVNRAQSIDDNEPGEPAP